MYREIVRGNDERDTHYYITRGRVGARKREKDAEERNNRNYSRITAEKKTTGRKRQEDDIERKQEKELRVLTLKK